VLTTGASLPVSATASAEIKTDAPGCIIALGSGGSGVSLSGGTNITADDCAVASNNAVSLTGGTTITTKNVDYATSFTTSGGSSIVPPAGTASVTYSKVTTSDPLSPSSGSPGSSEVTTATARLNSVSSITPPSPTIPAGSAVSFTQTGVTGLPSACSEVFNSSTSVYTVTCSGIANFGAITVNNVTVTLNTSAGNTYNFASSPPSGVTLSGAGGTYGFGAGLITSGTTWFPAGTYNVGADSSTGCAKKAPARESICNSGSLTIAGPSTFNLAGGIYNSGGSSLILGSPGTSNSYDIGADANGDSIDANTSTSVTLNDPAVGGTTTVPCGSTTSTFCLAGNITSGSSVVTLPAATEHDIKGSIALSGCATFGSGVYTVSGYVAFGNNNGGCSSPGSVSGSNVTFVIGANPAAPTGTTCAGQAFCVTAGFGNVNLTAPTSETAEDLLVIGPTSTPNTAGANVSEGGNATLSGAFYFPNGSVTMSGSGTISSGGGCLELIGSQVTLSGGSAATSSCAGLGGGSLGTTVTLVQ
jgi:hypothetical protein